ncbi:MAG: hypothetical protein GC168_16830 [Candidatus Hydrogenedens sp.]|nr:hypothetical protein [Candidatus Hydrogenedens sp.]
MRFHLSKIHYAEAAHYNPRGDARQQRLHGHSYKIELLAQGPPDAIGWVIDYADMKQVIKPVIDEIDHALLNELPGLEDDTTLPALERWIAARLEPHPPWYAGVRVSIDGDCFFNPVPLPADPLENLPARVRFTFEAAQSLPQLPEGHACRCVHGHSYILEAGAADNDALETDLAALYETLDHRYLNEIEGLTGSTVEFIARWVWDWMAARGHAPTCVVVQETYTARCAYFGE